MINQLELPVILEKTKSKITPVFHVAGLVIQHARQLFLKLYKEYCHFVLFQNILYQPGG